MGYMINEVYLIQENMWGFICIGCWHKVPEKGAIPFPTEREAKVALRVHKIGCKKS
jgi:hypothetical protein